MGGKTFGVLFAGGRLRAKQVVGGIDGRQTAFPDRAGRPLYLVEKGEPVRELFGRT